MSWDDLKKEKELSGWERLKGLSSDTPIVTEELPGGFELMRTPMPGEPGTKLVDPSFKIQPTSPGLQPKVAPAPVAPVYGRKEEYPWTKPEPGWMGDIGEFVGGLPSLLNVAIQTTLDVPRQMRKKMLPGAPDTSFDLPASLYKPETSSRFKREIGKRILFPWLTLMTGEAAARPERPTAIDSIGALKSPEATKAFLQAEKDRDRLNEERTPFKALAGVQTMVDAGWISQEAADEVITEGDYRTFLEYWHEDPLFLLMDAAVVLDPLLKLPGLAAGKFGKTLAGAEMVSRAVELDAGFAKHLNRMGKVLEPADFVEYSIIAAEEKLAEIPMSGIKPPTRAIPGMEDAGKYADFARDAATSNIPGVDMGNWAKGVRPPVKINTPDGPYSLDIPNRTYSPNIAIRGGQYGMAKLREASPMLDFHLYRLETSLGLHPGQQYGNFFFRKLGPTIEAELAPVIQPLEKSVLKIPKAERELFFDILEATVLDKATQKYIMKPTPIQVSLETAKALDIYKTFLKEFEAWHERVGIPMGETIASWNTRAKDLFMRLGGEKGQVPLGIEKGGTEAGISAGLDALDKEWSKFSQGRENKEFLFKWRQRAKDELLHQDPFHTEKIEAVKPPPEDIPPIDTDLGGAGTPTLGGQAKLGSKPVAPVEALPPQEQIFKTGEKVYVPDRPGFEDLEVVKDTGRGSVLLRNKKGTNLNIGRNALKRQADAPPGTYEEFAGGRPTPKGQGTLRDADVPVEGYDVPAQPAGEFKERGKFAPEGQRVGQDSMFGKHGETLIEPKQAPRKYPLARGADQDARVLGYKPESETLVWMKPQEYLKLVDELGAADPGYPGFEKGGLVSGESLDKMRARIRNQEPIDALFLDVDARSGKILNQEGRHRALASIKEGVDEVPVIIYHRNERGGWLKASDYPDVAKKFGREDVPKPSQKPINKTPIHDTDLNAPTYPDVAEVLPEYPVPKPKAKKPISKMTNKELWQEIDEYGGITKPGKDAKKAQLEEFVTSIREGTVKETVFVVDPDSPVGYRSEARTPEGIKPSKPKAPEKADFDSMVQEAREFQGASLELSGKLEGNNKAQLRLMKGTTKSQLDAYLMKKYGIPADEARGVTNYITDQNLAAIPPKSFSKYANEPWFKMASDDLAGTAGKISQKKPHAKPVLKSKTPIYDDIADKKAVKKSLEEHGVKKEGGEYVDHLGRKIPVEETRMDVSDMVSRPDVMQFRAKGTSSRMRDIKVWKEDPRRPPMMIWQNLKGENLIVDGHHRYEAMVRLKVKDHKVILLREADGISEVDARVMGAINNMLDNNAQAIDVAKFMRDTGMKAEDLFKEGISAENKVMSIGEGLSKLTDEVFRYALDEDISWDLAAKIGNEFEKHPDLQKNMLDRVLRGEANNPTDIEKFADKMIRSKYVTEETDLFGTTAVARDTVKEQVQIQKAVENSLRDAVAEYNRGLKGEGLLKIYGKKIPAEVLAKHGEIAKDVSGFGRAQMNQAGSISKKLEEVAGLLAEGKMNIKEAKRAVIQEIIDHNWPGKSFPEEFEIVVGLKDASREATGPALPGLDDFFKGEEGFLNTGPLKSFVEHVSENAKPQLKALGKYLQKKFGKGSSGKTDYMVDGTYWYPHLDPKSTSIGSGINRTQGLPGKPGKMGHMRVRSGSEGWIKDPIKIGEVLARRLKAWAKDEAVSKELMRHAQRGADGKYVTILPGDPIPQGWMAYYPDGTKQFYKATFDMLEGMGAELEKGATSMDPLWAGVQDMLKSGKTVKEVIGVKNAKHYLIPEVIGKSFKAHMSPMMSPALLKEWRTAWVDGVLAGIYTGRWQLNNLVGNVLMSVLDDSIWHVPRAVKMRKAREVMELIPEVAGGGFYETMTGGTPWKLYDNTTWFNAMRRQRKKLTEGLYGFNTKLDETIRMGAFYKRLKPHLEATMRKRGYNSVGSMMLDGVDNLSMDELAQVMRETFDADPHLKAQIGMDVSKSVYDFALRSPTEKWLAANTHPFLPWWKFVHSWALHMGVNHPNKLGIMKSLAGSAVEINREAWETAYGEGVWDVLPEEYKYLIPLGKPDDKGDMRFMDVRGGNPWYGLFKPDQVATGTMPWMQTGVKMATGIDLYRGKAARGPFQGQFSGRVPAEAAGKAATDKALAHTWWLFTGVMPYGNTGDLYMDMAHPYGKYPTATPLDPQPLRDSEGELKYKYDEDWLTRLGKLFGINFKRVGMDEVSRSIESRERERVEVENRYAKETAANAKR